MSCRYNLLRTQVLDEEVAANMGNERDPLPILYEAYERLEPAVAAICLAKFRTVKSKEGEGRKR